MTLPTSVRIGLHAALLLVGMTTAASAAWVVGLAGAFVTGSAGAGIGTALLEIGLSVGCHARGRALRARK